MKNRSAGMGTERFFAIGEKWNYFLKRENFFFSYGTLDASVTS